MQIEGKLEYPGSIAGEAKENHLLIRLKTPPISQGQRQPLVVGLAIDKSWSMKGEKMSSVIEAACSLVNWLTRMDYLAVIAYSNDVQVVQPTTPLNEKVTVTDKIRNIQVATSTNLSGGWLQTLRAIESKKLENAEGAIKRVILLTDGNPTLGIKEPEQLIQIARDHQEKGISTTTIGVGDDFNEEMLRSIAEAGGGNYYCIDDPEMASDIFFQEFGEIGALYAQAVELKLKLPTGCKLNRLLHPYSYNVEGDEVVIQLGDLRSDDNKTILLSLESVGGLGLADSGEIPITASYYNLMDHMKMDSASGIVSVRDADTGGTSRDARDPGDKGAPRRDPEVLVELLVNQTAESIQKASKRLREGASEESLEMVRIQAQKLKEHRDLAPLTMGSLLNRLENLEEKIRENSTTASKTFLATASSLTTKGTDSLDFHSVVFHDDIYVYETRGDIDLYKCPEIKAHVQEKMQAGYRFMIFDLSGTGHIDSSAIGSLIQIVGWLRRRGGELIVINLKDAVEKVFQITKLYNHIRVEESMESAREAVNRIHAVRDGS